MPTNPRRAALLASRRYRERMRKRGMRLVQMWVPDTRSRAFAKELARQSALVAGSPDELEAIAFIERAQDYEGWTG